MLLSINTNGWLIYGLSYLLLYPKYNCTYPDGSEIPDDSDDYISYCNPQFFCANDAYGWSIDWNDHNSLHNLTDKFNLNCASKLTISSLGMLFFGGFAAGSPFIPRMADVYGRKKVFWACMFI